MPKDNAKKMEKFGVNNGLPLPRLELRWIKTKKHKGFEDYKNHFRCIYELVLPLMGYDIRKENKNDEVVREIQRVKIGETLRSGHEPIWDGKVETPFRDGAHANWDSSVLKLPVYATYENFSTKIEPRQ